MANEITLQRLYHCHGVLRSRPGAYGERCSAAAREVVFRFVSQRNTVSLVGMPCAVGAWCSGDRRSWLVDLSGVFADEDFAVQRCQEENLAWLVSATRHGLIADAHDVSLDS